MPPRRTPCTRTPHPQLLSRAYRQVLLFVAVGLAAAAGLVAWAAGNTAARHRPYTFCIVFPEAEGIDKGVPLR